MGKNTEDRSGPAYPYTSIKDAIEIGSAVKEAGGEVADVSKMALAQRLGAEESSTAFAQRIASARCFGVIVGRGSVRLTPVGVKYFTGGEAEKRRSLLTFLGTPAVLKSLLGAFDGKKLPDEDAIGTILLEKNKLPKSWSKRVASIFRRSIDYAKVVDSSGILRFGFTVEEAKDGKVAVESEDDDRITVVSGVVRNPIRFEAQSEPSDSGYTVWTDRGVKVIAPSNMTHDQWERLLRYVKILEPIQIRLRSGK